MRDPFRWAGSAPAAFAKPGAGAALGRLARAAAPALGAGLDLLYPPRCAGCDASTTAPHGLCGPCWRDTAFITGPVCDLCGRPAPLAEAGQRVVCDGCLADPPGWQAGRAAILYEGTGRRIVLSLKHGDRLDLLRTVAGWMRRAAPDLCAGAEVIAPVPLHWRRYVARRYNQAAEIARQRALAPAARRVPDLLLRTRATPPLRGLDRTARAATLSGAIRLNRRHAGAVRGARVLLVDDVMTSGATLRAAADVLRAAEPARIDVLVLARVADAG